MFGENVGRAYVKLYANGDDVPDDVGDALDKLTPKFRQAGEEHSNAYSEWFQREAKKNSRKDADTFLSGFRDELQKGLKDWEDTDNAVDRLRIGLGKLKTIAEDNDRVDRRWMERFHNNLVNINKSLDESSTRVGKMFGKGSRNDLVNFIGAAVEGLSRLPSLATKVAESFSGMLTGKGGGGLTIGQMATQFSTSLVGILIGLAGLVTVLGAASTLVLGLAAALIGLVASAAFAAAALGAVAAVLLGPVAVGIGAVVAAIVGMDDKTRKMLKESVKPLVDTFKDAGDAAAEALGPKLVQAIDMVKSSLDGVVSLAGRTGSALGDVAKHLAHMTQSEGFKNFTSAFSDFIPSALRRMGRIVGSVFGGIGGIIEAAIPIANEFLDWMVKISDRFSDWANSAGGQKQLGDFFDRAADSAKAIGDFLHDAIVATAHLLSKGKDTGDDLFTKMADQLQRFTEYLTDPANQAAIADFFANGVDVAEKLGDAILDISDALGKLDSPESREFLTFLFDTFSVILEVVTTVSQAFTKLRIAVGHALGGISDAMDSATSGIGRAAGAIGRFFTRVGHAASDTVSDIIGFFRKLPGRIIGFLQQLPGRAGALLDKIAYQAGLVVGRTIRFFATLPGRIQGAISSLVGKAIDVFQRLASRIPGIITSIVNFFAKLPSRIASAISGLWGALKGQFTNVVTQAGSIVTDIVSKFVGLAGKILNAIGTIDIGSLIKVPGGAIGHFAEGVISGIKGNAAGGLGGITSGAQLRWVGEDGPEAIVPLNRPLGAVDPSVRGLSAYAQGLGRKTVDASGWTIVTTGPDPYTAAREVVNAFAAKAIF